jgi:Arc/MetJ-type ribon-helix-helix transcriptional regulator
MEKKKNITICLPYLHIELLDLLINLGVIQNRSDGIRNAIKEYIEEMKENLSFIKTMNVSKMLQGR